MILNTLNKEIVEAMKAKNALRVSTLKLLLSEIKNYQIDHPQMTLEEELTVVKKEAKKRKDAIVAYKNANRPELADKERQELEILQVYLPLEMGDGELEKLVDQALSETGASSMTEMGKVIGLVMQKTKGQADGGKVASLVKQKLSS